MTPVPKRRWWQPIPDDKPYWDPDYAVGPEPKQGPIKAWHMAVGIAAMMFAVTVVWWFIRW